ncbi:hypothetical protein [Streptomyces brevispora]|uniref:hypothetical protein n=1 Tax=Streptomyces brevispora TaxID=887462 RepID=UPI003825E59B
MTHHFSARRLTRRPPWAPRPPRPTPSPRSTVASPRLAVLIGSEPPRGLTPNRFIYLIQEVRDVLAGSSLGNFQDASDHLDSAAVYLTDALTEPATDQAALLAQARIHLRGAIETAS